MLKNADSLTPGLELHGTQITILWRIIVTERGSFLTACVIQLFLIVLRLLFAKSVIQSY